MIGEAVGAEEQLERRRSARVRDLYEGEEFESEEEVFEEDEDDYVEPYWTAFVWLFMSDCVLLWLLLVLSFNLLVRTKNCIYVFVCGAVGSYVIVLSFINQMS